MESIKFKIQIILFIILSNVSVFGQTENAINDSIKNQRIEVLENKINSLESQNNNLENNLKENQAEGFVLFFIGIFCAYWAQNSGRNPWLWFFCGLIFNVITLLVLLYKNKEDILYDEYIENRFKK
jgi:hypothetical protein